MHEPDPTSQDEQRAALPSRSRVYGLLLQVLLGLVLGLFLSDRAIGLYDTARDLSEDQTAHVFHETLGWTLRPGYDPGPGSRINALGLRSPEIPADAPPGEVRILGVGASRVFGAGSGAPPGDQTWSAHMQRSLDTLPSAFRVLNGGVVGYSARQAARRAAILAEKLQPDVILVFFSPGDQFMLDVSGARSWAQYDGRLVPNDLVEAWSGPWSEPLLPTVLRTHELLMGSHLYSRWRASKIETLKRPPEVRGYVLSRAEPPPFAVPYIQATFDEISNLQRLCNEQRIVLRVVILPEAYMDNEGRWEQYKNRWADRGGPPLSTAREEPIVVLAEEMGARGVHCYSLAPEVRTFGTDRARYTCDGAHWSREGHEVVAAALLRQLRAERLLMRLIQERAENPRVERDAVLEAARSAAAVANSRASAGSE